MQVMSLVDQSFVRWNRIFDRSRVQGGVDMKMGSRESSTKNFLRGKSELLTDMFTIRRNGRLIGWWRIWDKFWNPTLLWDFRKFEKTERERQRVSDKEEFYIFLLSPCWILRMQVQDANKWPSFDLYWEKICSLREGEEKGSIYES